jgi:hypothetical protein
MHLLDAMPGRGLTIAIQFTTITLLLAAAAGLRCRITVPLAWMGATFLFGMETSLGKVVHHDVLPLLAMIPILLAPSGEAWAIDARGREARPNARVGWPVRTAGLVVAGVYLIAGLSKLAFSGLDWILGDNLRNILYAASDAHGGNALALFVADRPWLASSIAGGALAFELTLWLVLVRPRLVPLYVVWAAALHTGIWLTIGINYVSWAVTVAAVFVDWPALMARLPHRPVADAATAVR